MDCSRNRVQVSLTETDTLVGSTPWNKPIPFRHLKSNNMDMRGYGKLHETED